MLPIITTDARAAHWTTLTVEPSTASESAMVVRGGWSGGIGWWTRSRVKRFIRWTPIVATCMLSTFFLTRLHAKTPIRDDVQHSLHSIHSLSVSGKPVPLQYFDASQHSKRLIVFGDSWSDNGQRPAVDRQAQQTEPRVGAQGQVWTDWLCAAVTCLHHDNFARSTPSQISISSPGPRGAVTDSHLLNRTWWTQARINRSTLILDEDLAEPLADLAGQVEEWLVFEKESYGTDRVKEAERAATVFSIWFSLWDLWYYSGGVFSNAESAVTQSLDTLFAQLDVISENWPLRPQVVLPDAIDLTFLPGWRKMRTGTDGSDPVGDDQRYAVLLVEQWNRALRQRAGRWDKGSIYIFRAGEWLLRQIRRDQLVRANLSDANGMGSDPSPWINAHSACLGQEDHSSEEIQDKGGTTHCQDPDSYLFWDDFHVGSAAMRMMGQDIAADITGQPAARRWGALAEPDP